MQIVPIRLRLNARDTAGGEVVSVAVVASSGVAGARILARGKLQTDAWRGKRDPCDPQSPAGESSPDRCPAHWGLPAAKNTGRDLGAAGVGVGADEGQRADALFQQPAIKGRTTYVVLQVLIKRDAVPVGVDDPRRRRTTTSVNPCMK